MADRARRLRALSGAAGIVGGAAAVAVALVAGPAPGLTGYVSEAGVDGYPHAPTYQTGVFLLAAGLLLLAAAVPPPRAAAALFALAGVGIGVSGAVPCTERCPLPPFFRPTPADLLHAAVSITAVTACVLAIVVVAASRRATPRWRRWSARAAMLAVPLSAAYAPAFLLIGRGALLGALERLLLLTVAVWLLATAAVASRDPGAAKHSRSPL